MVTSARSLNSTVKCIYFDLNFSNCSFGNFLCFLVALLDHLMQFCDRFMDSADLIDDSFFYSLFSDQNGSEIFCQHAGIEHQFFETFSLCLAVTGNKA